MLNWRRARCPRASVTVASGWLVSAAGLLGSGGVVLRVSDTITSPPPDIAYHRSPRTGINPRFKSEGMLRSKMLLV